jgi:succinate dehydrogenase (ubiquinone) membrane anchor subunit
MASTGSALFRRVLGTEGRTAAAALFRQPSARPTPSIAARALSVAPARPFQSTPRRSLLPPPPQTIQGTVNEPAPVPPPSPVHGSYHWTSERVLAAGLIPLMITPFAAGSMHPTLDASMCAILLLHSHMGFQSCIVDYVPKKRFPRSHRGLMWLLNGATVFVGIGLYEFETNDVGLAEAVSRVWKA